MKEPFPHVAQGGFSPKRAEIISLVTGGTMMLLVIGHVALLLIPGWRSQLVVATFLWFAFNVTMAAFGKDPSRRQKPPHPYTHPTVAVVVAVRNGNKEALRAMLDSLDRQESLARKKYVSPIAAVYVIENGTPGEGVEETFRAWQATTTISRTEFIRKDKPNKRKAHGIAVSLEREATVTLTVDGYTILAPNAVKEGLVPFRNPEVMSVGGLLYGQNRQQNLLTRILDMCFVSSLVVERRAWSSFGAVAANRGGLAFYRTWVIKRHLQDYLSQTVRGRIVTSGDDRMLTGYAALEGLTVFRPQCTGTTLLPATLRHASDRQSRWWRTHWIGALWVIRRFKPASPVWLLTVFQTGAFMAQAAVIPLLLVIDPIVSGYMPWAFLVYLVTLGYVRNMATLAVGPSEQSLPRRIAEFLFVSPLATLVDLWLGVALLWHGLFTHHQTEWQPHPVKVSA